MIVVIPLAAGIGLVLAVMSLPPFRRESIAPRVEPYLSGLHGRLSRLLHPNAEGGMGMRRWIANLLPAAGPDVAHRLGSLGRGGSPASFRLEQFVWGMVAVLVLLLLVGGSVTLGAGGDGRALPILGVIAFVSGWLGRDWWLTRETQARRARIREELPIAMDLVCLAIVSGESIAAACTRVPALVGGDVGAELGRVAADIRAGVPTIEALEAMSARIGEPAMARFVDAVATAMERGSPLADVLRGQADDLRETRKRDLMEMGGRREVLMLVPVVFLIMPVVVVFALWPGLMSLDLLVP